MNQNQITITFASAEDFKDAMNQIRKARAYAYRGNRLGALGSSILLSTIERAKSIEPDPETPAPKEQKRPTVSNVQSFILEWTGGAFDAESAEHAARVYLAGEMDDCIMKRTIAEHFKR